LQLGELWLQISKLWVAKNPKVHIKHCFSVNYNNPSIKWNNWANISKKEVKTDQLHSKAADLLINVEQRQ